jgi:hypothetical protein
MRTDAAECELDGPRITGPTTSLKMLGGKVVGMVFWHVSQSVDGALRSVVEVDCCSASTSPRAAQQHHAVATNQPFRSLNVRCFITRIVAIARAACSLTVEERARRQRPSRIACAVQSHPVHARESSGERQAT